MKITLLAASMALLLPVQAWAQQNEYQMTDICRASLHVMLDRDMSIMKSTQLSDGTAQVKYTRPQDGKHLSYRCRSTAGNKIGILDETLNGSRWYGEKHTDIQRGYVVKDGVLIIRTITDGHAVEEFFTHTDFQSSTTGMEEDNEVVKQFGNRLAENYPKGQMTLLKAYHVTSKPLNAYRVDFETSLKSLSSSPDDNKARVAAWQKTFCTSELKEIMHAHKINLVSGFTFRDGQQQLIATCF